jgi:hypothetical protein
MRATGEERMEMNSAHRDYEIARGSCLRNAQKAMQNGKQKSNSNRVRDVCHFLLFRGLSIKNEGFHLIMDQENRQMYE